MLKGWFKRAGDVFTTDAEFKCTSEGLSIYTPSNKLTRLIVYESLLRIYRGPSDDIEINIYERAPNTDLSAPNKDPEVEHLTLGKRLSYRQVGKFFNNLLTAREQHLQQHYICEQTYSSDRRGSLTHTFRLPYTEQLHGTCRCILKSSKPQWGELHIFHNFLVWCSDNSLICIVLYLGNLERYEIVDGTKLYLHLKPARRSLIFSFRLPIQTIETSHLIGQLRGNDKRPEYWLYEARTIPHAALLKDLNHFTPAYAAWTEARDIAWARYFTAVGDQPFYSYGKDLNQMMHLGVPDNRRGYVWSLASAASNDAQLRSPKYYKSKCRASLLLKKQSLDIKKDLARTLPWHPHVQQNPLEFSEALKNVLSVFVLTHPKVGYCQGMNFIAGLMLLYASEERAYHLLSCVCTRLAPDYHNEYMVGSQVDAELTWRGLAKIDSELFQFLHSFEAGVGHSGLVRTFIQSHLISLYINCLPLQLTLRCLDTFFCEGTVGLVHFALTFLHYHREALLQCEQLEDMMKIFSNTGDAGIDIEAFEAMLEQVSMPDIPRYWHERANYKARVIHERLTEGVENLVTVEELT